jgi:hypothetical protein
MAFPENVWSSRNGLAVRLAFGAVFRSIGVSDRLARQTLPIAQSESVTERGQPHSWRQFGRRDSSTGNQGSDELLVLILLMTLAEWDIAKRSRLGSVWQKTGNEMFFGTRIPSHLTAIAPR